MNRLSVMLLSTLLAVASGCAGRLTPQGAASLASLAAFEAGNDNPKVTKTMREIQPPLCAVVSRPDLTLPELAFAIEDAVKAKPEAKAVTGAIFAILQTAIAPVGTNVVNQQPYFKAVICDGWSQGLEWLPAEGVVTRNAPPRKAKPPGRFYLVK